MTIFMAASDRSPLNGHKLEPAKGPFPRFDERRSAQRERRPARGHEAVSRLHLAMRPGLEAAGEARRSLDRLQGAIEDDDLDTLRLLVTELITNAVRHGSRQHWIRLNIELSPSCVRVQVTDRGPGFVPAEKPHPHRDRPGGWGLCLVDRLSDRWGVILEDATSVWFELDRTRSARFAATQG